MSMIRDLRLQKGWSQTVLAVNAGLSIAVIARMEKGKPVSKNSVRLACMALGVKPESITDVNVTNRVRSRL